MANLQSKIESLLFISNQALTVKRLVDLTEASKAEVEAAIKDLMAKYNQDQTGIILQKIEDKVQFATSPDNGKLVKNFIKEETTGELTRPALETLTIIAYRGPIGRAQLEQIRGVNCAMILRNLLIRGLVEEKKDAKAMQNTYNVTFDFLKFLGLSQQSELPDYQKLNSSESLQKLFAEKK